MLIRALTSLLLWVDGFKNEKNIDTSQLKYYGFVMARSISISRKTLIASSCILILLVFSALGVRSFIVLDTPGFHSRDKTRATLIQTPLVELEPGWQSTIVLTEDGYELRVASWPSLKEEPSGTVVIAPGYREFIEKYHELIAELRHRGFTVVVFDWRGHGLSTRLLGDPSRGYVRSFDEYVLDLHTVTTQIKLHSLPKPHIALGQSMGGLVLLRHAQTHAEVFDRYLVSAPMTGFYDNDPFFVHAVSKLHTATGFGQNDVWGWQSNNYRDPQNLFGEDPLRFRQRWSFYQQEPHLQMGAPTWRWLYAASIMIGKTANPDELSRMVSPFHIISGGSDDLVDNNSHTDLSVASPFITRSVIDDASHDLFFGTDSVLDAYWRKFDELNSEYALSLELDNRH